MAVADAVGCVARKAPFIPPRLDPIGLDPQFPCDLGVVFTGLIQAFYFCAARLSVSQPILLVLLLREGKLLRAVTASVCRVSAQSTGLLEVITVVLAAVPYRLCADVTVLLDEALSCVQAVAAYQHAPLVFVSDLHSQAVPTC